MTDVNTTVRELILSFPDEIRNRTEALHYLLCQINSDWRWVAGEVVPSRFADPLVEWNPQHEEDKLAKVFSSPQAKFVSDDVFDEQFDQMRQRQQVLKEIVETVEERIHQRSELRGKVYPQSKYCLLLNPPNNIKEDWAQAVQEMRSYVISQGWRF